jgi:DNA modification methylase
MTLKKRPKPKKRPISCTGNTTYNGQFSTKHSVLALDARDLRSIKDESIDLVVTSPPYPMIQMWDTIFSKLSQDTAAALSTQNGNKAFETMHVELDKVWRELFRVLKPGCFACINIGDAVRTLSDNFQLYPNHARIITACRNCGFDSLPGILWRKQTNTPNKFMGSGMLPGGAYVTLEHEHILIFRKGQKKKFTSKQEKLARMESSFFWEERNNWFSDVWDFKGSRQSLTRIDLRERSAAFPFELPWRLVNMYSLRGDTVLDPFAGTGTTMLAALAAGRSSIGVDIDPAFGGHIGEQLTAFAPEANTLVFERIARHVEFAGKRAIEKGKLKYRNEPHGFSVMTAQETELKFMKINSVKEMGAGRFCVGYEPLGSIEPTPAEKKRKRPRIRCHQIELDL